MTKTIAVAILLAGTLSAQNRASPHETISGTIGGTKVTISYGRPYLKGRHVGQQVAPYGEPWRLGADEATKLTTEGDVKIGNLDVPKGSYSLFALPTASGWKLIVNKVADHWGTDYDESKDFGRVDMHVTKSATPVEQLTLSLDGGKLTIKWGNTVADVPISAK